ncbi:LytR/AlgR family response regulator transcription factor [Alteromonas sp. S167]|uniref:LytR/AlgR family response regulator transcription factor n=1 Tax=Alteromonas sp. S167 TaxID=3117402 RepID=UPI002FE3C838
MLKVLVADDERLARETIKVLLNEREEVTEIWEACNGDDAISLANLHHPDVVILDIEMPQKNGLEVAQLLPPHCIIVFVTAFNEHAIEAFELSAVDYILKPFDDERFHKMLNKISERVTDKNTLDLTQISDVIKQATHKPEQYKTRLIVRDPGRIRLVDVSSIIYIGGAGNYAELHLDDGNVILHRETLTSLESQLDPSLFLRIHRSTIVRRNAICELSPTEKGDYNVTLRSGECVVLSRRNRDKLEYLMS